MGGEYSKCLHHQQSTPCTFSRPVQTVNNGGDIFKRVIVYIFIVLKLGYCDLLLTKLHPEYDTNNFFKYIIRAKNFITWCKKN